MTKNDYFYKVPTTFDDPAWEEIKAQMPKPQEIPGMKFVDRVVMATTVPNRKNHRGETQNPARKAGTGKRHETLKGSFEKGINARVAPPKLIQEKTCFGLFGGHGRHHIFDELQYPYWMYDIYKYDVSSRTSSQTNNEEVLEDAALGDNGDPVIKPAEKVDYVGMLVSRIKKHGWGRGECIAWFNNSIKHSLTQRQITDYTTAAIRKEMAEGRIEWFKEHEINQIVVNHDPSLIILNTTDAEKGNNQRFIRTARSMMRSYVNSGGKTQGYCLWNSQACSHEGIDDAHLAAENLMNEFVNECLEFAAAVNFFKTKACEPQKVVFQKIGSDNLVGEVVDYPALG
jgi:hypothetical protein